MHAEHSVRYNTHRCECKEFELMESGYSKAPSESGLYRCAGPNCGTPKRSADHWWFMWTSFGEFNRPVLYLCPWDEELAASEAALHVCGELCAQKLQSQFMGNVRENQPKRGDLR